MKPLNATDRSKAFLNFFILFLVTITIIITTVFFSVQVPFKDNDKLRRENDLAKNEKIFLEAFEIRMQQTMNLLDSINRPGNVYKLGIDLDNSMKELSGMVNDSTALKGLCYKIIDNLNSIRTAREQIRGTNNNTLALEEKDRKIAKLEEDIKTCNDRVITVLSRQPR